MKPRRSSVALPVSLSALIMGGCMLITQPRPQTDPGVSARPPVTAVPPGPRGGPPLVRTTDPAEPPTPAAKAPAPPQARGPSQAQAHAHAQAPAQSAAQNRAAVWTGRYEYRYFPMVRVYFAPDRNRYYWLSARGWRVGNRLPRSVSIEGETSVAVRLDSDVPYLRHAEVEAAYPGPGREEQVTQAGGQN